MSRKLAIRAMTQDDVAAVRDLVTRCYVFLAEREGFSDAQLSRLLAERCTPEYTQETCAVFERYVATREDKIIGMVSLEENDVSELWVSPDRHHQGIGSRLFAKAEGLIRERGHRILTVRTTGYATPFYKAMGCEVAEKKACPFGPLEGWIQTRLRKKLGPDEDS